MEIVAQAPEANSFVPLIEHQSATPASFYSGPPVLHYHSQRCKIIVLEGDVAKSAAIQRLAQDGEKLNTTNGNGSSGAVTEELPAADGLAQRIVNDIDVWVTSESVSEDYLQEAVADHGAFRKLLLYSPASEVGIAIPYPTIALHAIQSLPAPSTSEQQGLYMQLLSSSTDPDAEEEDDETDSISLTIIPQNDAPPPPTTTDPDSHTDDHSPQPPTVAMFTALSNCSNLHPDPADDDQVTGLQDSTLFQAGMITAGDTSGGLPPPMPGSGGWITAENMGEFLDEQGNWIGGDDTGEEEALGAGAGTVRPRAGDEDHTADENGANDESKWRRTG